MQTSPHYNFSFTMRKNAHSHLEVQNFDWRPLQNMPSDAHKCLSHQRKMPPTIYMSCHSSFAHQRANFTSHIKLSPLKLCSDERFERFFTSAPPISKMSHSAGTSETHGETSTLLPPSPLRMLLECLGEIHLKSENFLHRPSQKLPSNAQKHTSRQMKRNAKYYLSWKRSFASHTPNLILHIKLSLLNLNSRQRFLHNLFSTLSFSKTDKSPPSSDNASEVDFHPSNSILL